MIQLSRAARPTAAGSVEFSAGSGAERARLKKQFDTDHCVRLEGLLEPGLAAEIRALLEEEDFAPEIHLVGESVRTEANARAASLLFMLINDTRLFRALEEVTGCGSIGSFLGRVYRIEADSGQSLEWHNDIVDDDDKETRLLALSINLGAEPYEGGLLQIRDAASKEQIFEAANLTSGDALLFRVSQKLQHRVTPVEGTVPRTAYAGWFRTGRRLLVPGGVPKAEEAG